MQTNQSSHTPSLRRIFAFAILCFVLLQPSLVLAADTNTTALSKSHLAPAVVYVTGDGHIHEIVLKGS